ncbi:MAG: hypothetical protein JEZ07_06460 [Phycisphaerae bacterium]|nr:hypothetical protein [Phycisphaerae bacterium]
MAINEKTPVKLTLKMVIAIVCIVGSCCFAVGKYVNRTETSFAAMTKSIEKNAETTKALSDNQLLITANLKALTERLSNHCESDLITKPADVRDLVRD